jgi:tRNA pseudouridine32 synthase/23S rRNA pseudouridine746 synthase
MMTTRPLHAVLMLLSSPAPRPFSSADISIGTSDDADIIGGRVWLSAATLCDHLRVNIRDHEHRVLELGSGTGAVGLYLAAELRDGVEHVCLTDGDPRLLPLLESNVQRNLAVLGAEGGVDMALLRWGVDRLPEGDFDLVVGADVTYDDDAHAPLAKCLSDALRGPGSSGLPRRAVLAEEHSVPVEVARAAAAADGDEGSGGPSAAPLYVDETFERFRSACEAEGLSLAPLSSNTFEWPFAEFANAEPFVFEVTVKVVAGASLPSATYEVKRVDEHLLVVEKGSGLLTVPGIGPQKADCLISRLRAEGYEEISHAPHRLDRDTSGLVVLGRTRAAHRALTVSFQERKVTKRYEALVHGWPESDSGECSGWIGKVRRKGEAHATFELVGAESGADGGRPALTRWRVLERCEAAGGRPRHARVELEPVTGRPHQLRLHMAGEGHPILGDEMHSLKDEMHDSLPGSGPSSVSGHELEQQEGAREGTWEGESRLCLHAAMLRFPHPAQKGMEVTVESDAPF